MQRFYNHGAASRSNELRELRLKQVLEHTDKTKASFRSFLENLALLYSKKTCPKCSADMMNTSKFFLVPVEKRNAKTLLPIIQQYILPGTTVVSDGWAAYFDIKKLPQQYKHFAVNHSVVFVDPDDPKVHTQKVENGWLHFKRGYRKRGGAPKNLLLRYIHKYSWRKAFRGHNTFFHFWDQVAELYPVDIKTPVVSDDEDEEEKSEATQGPLSEWTSSDDDRDGLDEVMNSPPPSAAAPEAEDLNDEMNRFSFGF